MAARVSVLYFFKKDHFLILCVMNKKTKKQLEVARQKLKKLHGLLTAAKQQTDEPREIEDLKSQIQEVENQIETIKASA